jgi:hypothetical protein
MSLSRCLSLLAAALLTSAAAVPGPHGADVPRAREPGELFRETVLPLLKTKCFACHGDDEKKRKGSLDLRTREGLLKGGQSKKPALTPGDPAKSLLHQAVSRTGPTPPMPPKENDKLSDAEVEIIRKWIVAGAPWPDANKPWDNPNGVTVTTSGGRTPEWTNRKYNPADLWAYQPIKRPKPPGDGHPIDAFLQQKQKDKGVERTAPAADKITLLRRATFDLTGLPPTPDEIDAFLKDDSPDAWAKVVARLLDSKHHGEQQARLWLDVVRYADTNGFSNDFERPNAWRYRDYVVRSFNDDKPFDRFITEQLAGDELDPKNPELLIAVGGFLRSGPWEHTGMTVAAVTRQHYLDDVTHNTAVAFLGQGLRCAACHDHKFDPLPTKDYYRIQAVFAPVQFAERDAPFLKGENTAGFAESKAVVEQRLKATRAEIARIQKKSEDAITAFLKERGVAKLADLPEKDRPHRQRYGLSKLELSLVRIAEKRALYYERELIRYEPLAFSVYDGSPVVYLSLKASIPMPAKRDGEVPAVRILPGGSIESPSEAVTPGVLSALKSTDASNIPDKMEGRRLALAKWIATPDNPLTARVIVNRIWQQHFGKGLVATPNNFGKMGKKPTHPELLDWLAAWFIDNGWSIKKLHKLIMTSAAYQQSGTHPDAEKLRTLDPNNELLASYPSRRLAAEEIRDAQLAVTGELNRTLGGPGVFPEINWEVALQPRHIMGSVAPPYLPSPKPEQRNRRTLYAFRYRTLSDPMLEVFNRPGSEISCERRDQTTVTPQAFALFNGEFSHDRALALAAALEKKYHRPADRIDAAFRLCYGRTPTDAERKLCLDHVAKMTEHHTQHKPAPVKLPTSVKRKMVEEMTGEEYEWAEKLEGMEDYQRDLKPWDVGPNTRALADVCLVLMNSNEFLYVR